MPGCTVLHGDMLAVLPLLPSESIDAVVCDPPYHLTSIVKRFGGENAAPAQFGTDGAFARASRGFMGKQWDGGDIANRPETWIALSRVLKPGGHVLAFGGTRTYHRMTCAIEDAGFEIRDSLLWLYGTGFPKSHDVSKAIDARLTRGSSRTEDMRRARMGDAYTPSGRGRINYDHGAGSHMGVVDGAITAPATPEAARWSGWGSALKPSHEPIVCARKPLIGTLAENVLEHGTGGLNIDGCRIASEVSTRRQVNTTIEGDNFSSGMTALDGTWGGSDIGRWPANTLHDGSKDVVETFALFGEKGGAAPPSQTGSDTTANTFGVYKSRSDVFHKDAGTAARFFAELPYSDEDLRFHYSGKASKVDRAGSKHPTVKPIALMRWLCRLVTPPGGTVLDPFAGSGTTGAAALAEGFVPILIEREQEYIDDIMRRLPTAKLMRPAVKAAA